MKNYLDGVDDDDDCPEIICNDNSNFFITDHHCQ